MNYDAGRPPCGCENYLLDVVAMCLQCLDDGRLDVLTEAVRVTAQELRKDS